MSGVNIDLDLNITLSDVTEADEGGRGGYGGGGSYILLRNKLQSYHVDKVIMSVSWTDEERTKMRSQSSVKFFCRRRPSQPTLP